MKTENVLLRKIHVSIVPRAFKIALPTCLSETAASLPVSFCELLFGNLYALLERAYSRSGGKNELRCR